LYNMVSRHLHEPHRFICITDDPKHIKCETYPLWDNPVEINGRNNYTKLRLFKDAHLFGERIMYLDLDTLILDDISHLARYADDFVICKGRGAKYNSSYYLLKSGTHQHVWDNFTKDSPAYVKSLNKAGTDQVWISDQVKDARTVGRGEGVYMYGRNQTDITGASIVFFPISTKPWQMKTANPEIYNTYMSYVPS